jgi:hypothetical protein
MGITSPFLPLISSNLLKNAHLLRFPNPSSLRRTSKYASFLRIPGALHLGIFEQPAKNDFFSNLPIMIAIGLPRPSPSCKTRDLIRLLC